MHISYLHSITWLYLNKHGMLISIILSLQSLCLYFLPGYRPINILLNQLWVANLCSIQEDYSVAVKSAVFHSFYMVLKILKNKSKWETTENAIVLWTCLSKSPFLSIFHDYDSKLVCLYLFTWCQETSLFPFFYKWARTGHVLAW